MTSRKGTQMLEKDIKKVLFSQEDIVAKTKELGQQLTEDYAGKNPLLVCVLKGAVPFMAELIKHIDTHIEMDFMVVSSYGGGTVSSGEVKILKDVDTNVEGRDIIFIEDIIDTGRTLLYLRDMFSIVKPIQSKSQLFLINQKVVLLILRQITYVTMFLMNLSLVSD